MSKQKMENKHIKKEDVQPENVDMGVFTVLFVDSENKEKKWKLKNENYNCTAEVVSISRNRRRTSILEVYIYSKRKESEYNVYEFTTFMHELNKMLWYIIWHMRGDRGLIKYVHWYSIYMF